MTKLHYNIKKILFGGILCVLFIPLLQMKMNVVKEKSLKGAINKKEKTWFKLADWFTGKYQDSTVVWFNENFGFRSTGVRLRNQIAWILDKKPKAKQVVLGKNNYAFEEKYISAYNGKDFLGEDYWVDYTRKLKVLQDSLQTRNVLLMVVLAPSKTAFYAEYLPDSCAKAGKQTNYLSFSSELKNKNVNTLDFYKWFMAMKNKSEFPIYSIGGVHWSKYASTLAVDSMIKFIEKKTNSDMVSMQINNTSWSDTIGDPDNDIYEGMNLLCPLVPTRMAYCNVSFEDEINKYKPSLYVTADSYFWQIYHDSLAPRVFNEINFNYYNTQTYGLSNKKSWEFVNTKELPYNVNKFKVLVLMATEPNLTNFTWGFTDELLNNFNIKKQ